MNSNLGGSLPTASVNSEKSQLIGKICQMAMDATYGMKNFDEQQMSQTIGELVKIKLLSAEDSYRLRDMMGDRSRIDRIIDRHIDRILQRRSIRAN